MCILGVKFRQWVPVGASDRSERGRDINYNFTTKFYLNELTFSIELKTFEILKNSLECNLKHAPLLD